MSSPPHSALWKKLLLSVALPIAIFVGGELLLRVIGFGQPLTFFIPDDRPGYWRTNPAFTSLVFPASFGLKPENFRIAKKKPPNTYRVFVLGESAAMGVPEPGFGLASQLRAQWQAAYPARKIEVYNLGVTAINSHCVRLIADEAMRLEPDLLVVYMGNNEVVGPFGPSAGASGITRSLPFIRTSLWVRSTRIGQLIQRLESKLLARGAAASEWRGMEMFTGRTVSASDPRLGQVYENFGDNLNDLLSAASHRNVPVALCTVAVNVHDCSPFASVHRPTLSGAQLGLWEDAMHAARDAVALEQFAEARTLLENALAIDPEYSETHYAMATVLERLGEHPRARAEFVSAWQLDALRFRADAKINEMIRQAGPSFPKVTLIDTALALGSTEGTSQLAGRTYFFEHVHLTWEGNYAVASAVRNAVTLGGQRPTSQTLDAKTLAERVGFTDAGRIEQLQRMNELTRRPPFTGQATFAHDRARAEEQLSSLLERLKNPAAIEACLTTATGAWANDSTNAFLPFHVAQLQAQLGRWEAALEANRRAAELVPASPELLAQRAYLLLQSRDFSAAEATLRKSQARFPYYFQTYGLFAQLWSESGRLREGVSWCETLVATMPDSRAALELYGQLLHASGEDDKAEAAWKKALVTSPDSEGSLMPLAERLLGSRRANEAIELLERAYRYNPKNLTVIAWLERIYDQRGEVENRIKYMRAMIDAGPVRPELFLDLGVLLRERKSFHEANIAFLRAMRAAEMSGDESTARTAAALRATVAAAR